MKYEDLKCEFCDGQGEKEKNIDGMDCPVTCTFCNGTGIDQGQLKQLSPIPELTEALELANSHVERSLYPERKVIIESIISKSKSL